MRGLKLKTLYEFIILLNNHFFQTVPISFNGYFHSYNTSSRNNICKSTANSPWGHWSPIDFRSVTWNKLDILLRMQSHRLHLNVACLMPFYELAFVYILRFFNSYFHIGIFLAVICCYFYIGNFLRTLL